MSKKIIKVIIFCIIFTNIIIQAVFAVNNTYTNDSDTIYVVRNNDDFFRLLPYAINKNLPIIIQQGEVDDNINRFSDFYNGKVNHMDKEKIITLLKNNFTSMKTVVITSKEDIKITTLAAQVACKLQCPLVFDEDKDIFLKGDNFKKIILLGNIKDDISLKGEINRAASYEEVRKYYESYIKDNNTNLNVYVEEQSFSPMAAYLAAYRHGDVVFNLKEIKNKNRYFAWVINPEKFGVEKYVNMYKYICRDESLSYNKGIGIITGKVLEDISLMLNRSFFYSRLTERMKNNIFMVSDLDKNNKVELENNGWKYVHLMGEESTKEEVINQLKDARYVEIFAHGSPSGFKLSNGNLHSEDLPALQPLLFVAEACETGEIWNKDSIALQAINRGAVAYVGSIKIGGVTGEYENPYLLSTGDVPISNIVLCNNEAITKYYEKTPRAIVVGDPMWGMFDKLGQFDDDNTYSYKLPFDIKEDCVLPILTDKDITKFKAVSIKNDGKTRYLDFKIRKGYDASSNAFILVRKSEGTLKFDTALSVMMVCKRVIAYILGTQSDVVNGMIDAQVIIPIIMIVILIVGLTGINKKPKVKLTIGKLITSLLFTVLISCFNYFVLESPVTVLKLVLYFLLELTILNIYTLWKKELAFSIIMILPLFFVCLFTSYMKIFIPFIFPGLLILNLAMLIYNYLVSKILGFLLGRY